MFLGDGRFTGPRRARGRGARAALQARGRRDRRARRAAADPGPRRGGLPHERDGVLADRAPGAARGDRRRARSAASSRRPSSGSARRSLLIEVAPQVLIREDPDAAALVQAALARDGVELVLDAKLLNVAKGGGRQAACASRTRRASARSRSTRCWSGSGARRTSRASGSRRPASRFDPRARRARRREPAHGEPRACSPPATCACRPSSRTRPTPPRSSWCATPSSSAGAAPRTCSMPVVHVHRPRDRARRPLRARRAAQGIALDTLRGAARRRTTARAPRARRRAS